MKMIFGTPQVLVSDPVRFGGVQRGELLIGRPIIRDGRLVGLTSNATAQMPDKILLPKFAEAHIHLDKCHTIDRMDFTGGDLSAALKAQWDDKAHWSHDDLCHRIQLGLEELLVAGVGVARTHVDWGRADDPLRRPLAWDVIGDLAQEASDRGLTLQRAALTGITEMADLQIATEIAKVVAQGDGVLGAFVGHHTNRRAGITHMFRLADQFGLPLDFHVDEGLDPDLDGVELIADIALEMGFQGPVLLGHACALASKPLGDVTRIGQKLAKAGISVTVLPTTNLHLQGRVAGGTPDRRGLTRFHELQAQGVNMVVATDNICDAFCPIGRHDPLYALSIGVLAGHLDPPFGSQLATITHNARRAMGLSLLWLDGAVLRDLLVFDSLNLSRLIASQRPPTSLHLYQEHADV